MTTDEISGYFENAKTQLKADRDAMVQKIKDEISASKNRALSRSDV
ncbi:MAG TPA: hypothetical protein VE199_03590 [Nitrososphaera sp.]|jgi:hypothetical protein|nr:hypothetical protein [Nitrososphaera sp.]